MGSFDALAGINESWGKTNRRLASKHLTPAQKRSQQARLSHKHGRALQKTLQHGINPKVLQRAFGHKSEDASSFDRLAGLSEDHDPADGAKLRELVGKISMSVAAHEAAKSMEECSKHVAAIKTALDEVNPILDRL